MDREQKGDAQDWSPGFDVLLLFFVGADVLFVPVSMA